MGSGRNWLSSRLLRAAAVERTIDMSLFNKSYRHLPRQLSQHWPLYGLVLLLLTIASAMLSSVPLLSRRVADDSLRRTLNAMPVAGRNLLLEGRSLSADIENSLQSELGDVYSHRLEMRERMILAERMVVRPSGPEPMDPTAQDILNFHLYSFKGLEDLVTILDGRMPRPGVFDDVRVEVAVGRAVADFHDLHVKDVLHGLVEAWQFEVVGIVEPISPNDARWWGDHQLLPFNLWRRISLSPDIVEVNSGILLHPETMASPISGRQSWRVILDSDLINPTNAAEVATAVRGLESSLSSRNISLNTRLVEVLDQFAANIEVGQLSMLLLMSQALLAVLYALAMLGQAVLAQATSEIASLTARGHSLGKVTRRFALRYCVLAIIAWPLGVGTAVLFYGQAMVPGLSWGLGGVAVSFGLSVLIVPIPGAARRGMLGWLQRESRPTLAGEWRRRLLFDGAVLGLGALSYWQLRQFSEQALSSEQAITIDPLLLLGPTVLLLGFALLMRHVAPLIIRLAAWIGVRSRRLILPLALAWLGRDHGRSGRIIFLVSLASGLTFFAAVFVDSLSTRQDEMALYRSGADLRWSVMGVDLPLVTNGLMADGDVSAMATVFRGKAIPDPAQNSTQIEFLAVLPNATNVIAPYPTGLNPISLETTLAQLADPAPDAVPVLLSRRNVIPDAAVGDRFTLQVGAVEVSAELRGIIEEFATLRSPFLVMNLDSLTTLLSEQGVQLQISGSYELWATVKKEGGDQDSQGQLQDLDYRSRIPEFGSTLSEPRLLSDAAALRAEYGNHLLSKQITEVLRLNVVMLVVLSFVSLLMLQLLDAWRRRHSWGSLMTLGVTRLQVAGVIIGEGLTLVSVGQIVGVVLGFALAQITLPLLAVTLSASIGGSTEAPLLLNWATLGRLVLGMSALYLLAVLTGAWVNGRVELAQLVRTGE